MSAKRPRRSRQIECEGCKGRRLLRTILEGKPCSRCGHVQSPSGRKAWSSVGEVVRTRPFKLDAEAARENERFFRAAFIRERQRQEGCLASEAARRWDDGER